MLTDIKNNVKISSILIVFFVGKEDINKYYERYER